LQQGFQLKMGRHYFAASNNIGYPMELHHDIYRYKIVNLMTGDTFFKF
jgi:hypothetical protein